MPEIRIGTAGWSIPRAVAEAVPGTGSHLERYSRVLPCAEINSSFYRPSRTSTWLRWGASVPEDFRFSVKAPKSVSHEAALDSSPGTLALLAELLDQARLLGDKLGPILFQLPPKQAFDAQRANGFFAHFRGMHTGPCVLEPRHATWFTPEAEAVLIARGVSRAAADPARVPEAATPGGDASLRYFRLHGTPRTYYSSYTEQYLGALAEELAAGGPGWVIFDNTASGAALHNALTLRKMLGVE